MNFNQSTYLQRIQYTGPLTPTLEVLQNLQRAHLFHVPFENLDVYLKRPIELGIDHFYTKIVQKNRGGFCYELNGLFCELLRRLGFDAEMVSCRVFNVKKQDYGAEFDHLAILVKIGESRYLTDVGFGDFTRKPLHFVLGETQHDPNGTFVLDTYENDYFRVNKKTNATWNPEYIFQDKSRVLSEFAGMCHYHQHHPESHFTGKRLISKPLENGRITLTGNILKRTSGDKVEETPINNEEEFKSILLDSFQVRL